MSETVYSSDIVSCTYDKDNQLVELVWKTNTHSSEYRKLFTAIIGYSKNHKIQCILSDMRQEGLVNIEDARWLNKEILSVAVAEKLQKLAMVTEDTIFASAYTDMLKNKLGSSAIQVKVFLDCESARAWLLSE